MISRKQKSLKLKSIKTKGSSKVLKKKNITDRKQKSTEKKTKNAALKKSVRDMNIDELLTEGILQSDSEEESEEEKNCIGTALNQGEEDMTANDSEDSNAIDEEELGEESDVYTREDGNDSDNEEENPFTKIDLHRKSLEKLKFIDPEFYKYLEENDKKLLDFTGSDSESEEEDETNKIHKPPDSLEVASDESDFEAKSDEEGDTSINVVTLKMVKIWTEELQSDKSVSTIRTVVKAFHAALQRVSSNEQESSGYRVDGSSVFNAVVQMCVLELQPAIKRFLHLEDTDKLDPGKCKRWTKVKVPLRSYLGDLLKLLGSVASPDIQSVLLKHLHQMIPFLANFSSLYKPALKKLVNLWSTGEEVVQVVAFLCILRLTNSRKEELLDKVLKRMYMAYINNCKFVSPNSLPRINFMRRSLAEMFALDDNFSYKHVFLYIRQLAIHLRNAIVLKQKECVQAVYNWQYFHSMYLWCELLALTSNRPALKPLLYPLVQIVLGTIKLIPTAQYFPLRFHCLQMLIELSKHTQVFIPILPFLIEILDTFDFNKKHKKVSMKPMDFTCILRTSKSQRLENGFKDAVIEKIYQQLLEYLSSQSHSISFPDVTLPLIMQLKKFLKTCKVTNYCKKLKQIKDKIEENSQLITNKRIKVSFSLTDDKTIDAWESAVNLQGTPLTKFYQSWNKIHLQQMAKRATNNEKLGEYSLPVLKKLEKKRSAEKEGAVELFPSDDEEEKDELLGSDMSRSAEETLNLKKRRKLKNKNLKSNVSEESCSVMHNGDDMDNDVEDIIEELTLSDLT